MVDFKAPVEVEASVGEWRESQCARRGGQGFPSQGASVLWALGPWGSRSGPGFLSWAPVCSVTLSWHQESRRCDIDPSCSQAVSRSGNQLAGLTESRSPGVSGRFCGYVDYLEGPLGMSGARPFSFHSLEQSPPTPTHILFPQSWADSGMNVREEICWALRSRLDSPRWACLLSVSLCSPTGVRRFGELVTHRSQWLWPFCWESPYQGRRQGSPR